MIDEVAPDGALVAAVDRFFADTASAARAAPEPPSSMPARAWAHAESLGLTRAGIAEAMGGSGGSLNELLLILVSAAAHGTPLPIAENHLAGWLLSEASIRLPDGVLTVALDPRGAPLTLAGGTIRGRLRDVPWADSASHVVAFARDEAGVLHVVAFDPAGLVVETNQNLAGEPTATLDVLSAPAACATAPFDTDAYLWRGALCRTAQMAGALQAVARLTVRYCEQRVQFGKPIARFQAVQEHIVAITQAAEVTTMALWSAARACNSGSRNASFEVCAAKLVANESARTGARSAHQAHGAVGMTREYPLHLYTRPLHLWRHQFGTERQLARALGGVVSEAPSFARILSDKDNGVSVSWPRT